MLETADLGKKVSEKEFKPRAKELRSRLSALQQPIKQKKLPVLILLEGWDAAGKGKLISNLILNFDPRGYRTVTFVQPTELEKREPVLWRYWNIIPKKGQIVILDRSWYMDVSTARIDENLNSSLITRRMDDINIFERQLTDAGYLILKFFIHIDRREQKKRFEKLVKDKNTAWRVTEQDWKHNRQYEKYYRAFDEMRGYTNTVNAPWHVISGMDFHAAVLDIFQITEEKISGALRHTLQKESPQPSAIQPGPYHLLPAPKLSEIPLDKTLGKKEYHHELKKQQALLGELHEKLYRKKVPVIIAYEGWDAAGKGGDIRRLAKALDPRGYQVVPIAAPTPEEAARHYLWRFWTNLPRDGHIAIFDRTWYGRVMVERIEGFCTENDWQRAYREINEFERQLHDWGAVIIKFWLQIDQDEQLRRFQDRQNTPSKQWKITEEDWRNRSKWEQYEICVNEMLKYTSTDFAPWHVIPSQDKKYGRILTLKTISEAIEDRFRQKAGRHF